MSANPICNNTSSNIHTLYMSIVYNVKMGLTTMKEEHQMYNLLLTNISCCGGTLLSIR